MIPNPPWVSFDQKHVWHPYTQMKTAPPPIPIARADGVYLYTPDGRKLLDGISSWWVNIHGHNHPRLNRALSAQADKLSQVVFAGLSHEPGARLAHALASRAPGQLPHVFYSDDGSTAVEVGMKMAYQYWHNRGEIQRTLFVGLTQAYHGDTFGTMAAGDASVFHGVFRDVLFTVERVHAPHCQRCPVGRSWPGCGVACIDTLRETIRRCGDRIAAVLIEPMLQGAGGMLVWPAEFLRQVRQITQDAGILLIADEVLTGFGRTGAMFACEHGPIAPDILCLSKAITGGYLPLGATLATEAVYEAFLSGARQRTLFHGHSYTGNALACALGLESLALLEENRCIERVARLERLFQTRLRDLATLSVVRDTRCIGGVAAVELHGEGGYLAEVGPILTRRFHERGILLRPLGNVVYFMPPYAISDEEAGWVLDVMAEELDALDPKHA